METRTDMETKEEWPELANATMVGKKNGGGKQKNWQRVKSVKENVAPCLVDNSDPVVAEAERAALAALEAMKNHGSAAKAGAIAAKVAGHQTNLASGNPSPETVETDTQVQGKKTCEADALEDACMPVDEAPLQSLVAASLEEALESGQLVDWMQKKKAEEHGNAVVGEFPKRRADEKVGVSEASSKRCKHHAEGTHKANADQESEQTVDDVTRKETSTPVSMDSQLDGLEHHIPEEAAPVVVSDISDTQEKHRVQCDGSQTVDNQIFQSVQSASFSTPQMPRRFARKLNFASLPHVNDVCDNVRLGFEQIRKSMEPESPQEHDTNNTGEIDAFDTHLGTSQPKNSIPVKEDMAATRGMYDMSDDEEDWIMLDPSALIHGLDLKLLAQLIADAEPTLPHVANKNVVALLGKTGVGKSTLINAMSGCALKREKFSIPTSDKSQEQGKHTRDVYTAVGALEGFKIGHDFQSMTKCIKHYSRRSSDDREFVYVDSPGFNDTAGAEVDIATSVSFKKVGEACKCLRFVVLINCASFLETRGGAIRDVVDLVASFLHNFFSHRTAFTFLFTHVEVLPGAKDKSLAEIKEILRGLLTETEKGTVRDPEVKKILKWMGFCLEEGFPFVDVFHPEKSDISSLILGFEKFSPEADKDKSRPHVLPALGLADGEKPGDVLCCGMTQQAISKVKLELNRLHAALIQGLKGRDLAKLKDLSQILLDLKCSIDIEDIAEAFTRSSDEVSEHMRLVNKRAFDSIGDCKCLDGAFGIENARRILEDTVTVDSLCCLGLDIRADPDEAYKILQYLVEQMLSMVHDLREHLQDIASESCIRNGSQLLARLNILKEAHAGFGSIWSAGIETFEAFIQASVPDGEQEIDVMTTLRPLADLESICTFLPDLRQAGVVASNLEDMRARMETAVKNFIEFQTEIASAVISAENIGFSKLTKDELQRYCESVSRLHTLSHTLEALDGLTDLKNKGSEALQGIIKDFDDAFALRSNRLKAIIESGKLDTPCGTEAALLKSLLDAQPGKQLQGMVSSQKADFMFKDIIDAFYKLVNDRCVKLRTLCEQVDKSRVESPEDHIELLGQIKSSTWLDAYLPKTVKCVIDHIEEFESMYSKHMECKTLHAQEVLCKFFVAASVDHKLKHELKSAFDRVQDLSLISSMFQQMRTTLSEFEEGVRSQINQWCCKQADLPKKFPTSLDQFQDFLASSSVSIEINMALSVSRALLTIEPTKDSILKFSSSLEEELNTFKGHVTSLAQGCLSSKKVVMDVLESWKRQNLELIAENFPGAENLANVFREEVQQEARRIQDMIVHSYEHDKVESELRWLIEACTLDDYIGNQASSELQRLRSMLEMKHAEIDDVFREKIDNCDFSDFFEYLQPYDDTRDPIKKKRLEEIWDAASASVERRISNASAEVKRGDEIVQIITVLTKAADIIGGPLKKRKSVDVLTAVDKVKSRVREYFDELLRQFDAAVRTADVREMINQQKGLITYHGHTKHMLDREAQQRAAGLLEKAGDCLSTLDVLVQQFVENTKNASKDREDTSELSTVLSKFKLAMDVATECETEDAADVPLTDACCQYVVIGGIDKGGVIVREGADLKSNECDERLSHGSRIHQLERRDKRVFYELIDGKGPKKGWVSTEHSGKKLLVKAEEVWKVCGQKGVAAQTKKDRNSKKLERLQDGSLVHNIAVEGDRLHFKLISGKGPEEGWTNIRFEGGKELLLPIHTPSYSSDKGLRGSLSQRRIHHGYHQGVLTLTECLNSLNRDLRSEVEQKKVFISVVEVYNYLQRELDNGLCDHLPKLSFVIAHELDRVRNHEERFNEELRRQLMSFEDIKTAWLPHLDSLYFEHSHYNRTYFGWYSGQYQLDKQTFNSSLLKCLEQSSRALQQHDYERVGCSASPVRQVLLDPDANKHLLLDRQLEKRMETLVNEVIVSFTSLQDDLIAALNKNNILEFDTLFLRYYKFVLNVDGPIRDIRRYLDKFHAVMFTCLNSLIEALTTDMKEFNFVAVSRSIELLRSIGHSLTGVYAIYFEQIRGYAGQDDSLQKINDLCNEHFGGKTLSDLGMYYALLEVRPNASEDDIKKAYHRKCRQFHSDKQASRGIFRENPDEMQKRIARAKEELMKPNVRKAYQDGSTAPFAAMVMQIPQQLREHLATSLCNQDYAGSKKILVGLNDLRAVANLVEPKLDAEHVRSELHRVVREHLQKISVGIQRDWERRNWKQVQEDFTVLDKMDANFSAYSDIYSDSVRKDIHKNVEREIEALHQKALQHLSGNDQDMIESLMKNFAETLVLLGRILDELPKFKDLVITKINILLDFCQDQPWGFPYVFRLGMVLAQGKIGKLDDKGNVVPEDQRIGKVLVGQFRHFKEVETFVWNEQTEATQKDVKATVEEIQRKRIMNGTTPTDADVGKERLLIAFEAYRAAYDKYFHEWSACGSGPTYLEKLVSLASVDARKLHPCRAAKWTEAIRQSMPELIAKIAIYYTISKSGDSYKRLLKAGSGHGQQLKINKDTSLKTDNVLQKPHNIQILTILHLFGCDSTVDGLLNQLMQIRTGEGKSMILGMSSILLGLLGFRVRCVCYSEYLSQRDENLFKDMFFAFGVSDRIVYSRITTFSEDQVAAKGDIRELTLDLLRGNLVEGEKPTGNAKTLRPTLEEARRTMPLDDSMPSAAQRFLEVKPGVLRAQSHHCAETGRGDEMVFIVS